jgi:ATP-binding cassette subfamily A (ABC1) protein 3
VRNLISGQPSLQLLQFLDEADLLADNIAILAAPGKLVAQGSPVALKSTLGQGYTVEVRFHHTDDHEKLAQLPPSDLLPAIRAIAPDACVTKSSPFLASYHLMSKDTAVVENVLRIFDLHADAYFVDSYDIRGTSIEDIFLDLMNREHVKKVAPSRDDEIKTKGSLSEEPLELSGGRKRTPMSQTLTIFHKRALIARRAWLPLLMAVCVGIAGSCIPLFFLDQPPVTCVRTYKPLTRIPLFLPAVPVDDEILVAPASAAASLGPLAGNLTIIPIGDNQEFISTIQQNYRNISPGGISLDLSSGQSLIAWETDPPGIAAPALLNLVSNILYNARLNATSPGTTSVIWANYASFPLRSVRVLRSFRWLIFFGAAMVSNVMSGWKHC